MTKPEYIIDPATHRPLDYMSVTTVPAGGVGSQCHPVNFDLLTIVAFCAVLVSWASFLIGRWVAIYVIKLNVEKF